MSYTMRQQSRARKPVHLQDNVVLQVRDLRVYYHTSLGAVRADVTDLDPSFRGVAMVFQSYALYPHMSVEENIGFGLRMNGMSKSEVRGKVAEAASILHLEGLLKRKWSACTCRGYGRTRRLTPGPAAVSIALIPISGNGSSIALSCLTDFRLDQA